MAMTQKRLLYNEIIQWLETYFSDSKFKKYRSFEMSKEFTDDVERAKTGGIEFFIDPMLPIDFFTVEKKENVDDKTKERKPYYSYNLFWICLKEDSALERKLQFYRFFLSRISKLKGVSITIVFIDSTDSGLKRHLMKIAQTNGFGLWELDLSSKKPIILHPSTDYREHMKNVFLNPPKDMDSFEKIIQKKATIQTKAGDIALFYDGFVREAVEAMVGIPSKQIGKRYIERKILDSVFELKHVTFAKTLKDLVTRHLIDKDDDYNFVSNAFDQLWKECELKIDYSEFLKISEFPLQNIFATGRMKKNYRDHYLHQFQVFLLGTYIIDKLWSKFPPNFDKQWLIASSFHDMAYPIQLYDEWATAFFEQSLGIKEMGLTDMKSHFVEKSLLTSTGHVINILCKNHLNRPLKDNWLENERPLIEFYHQTITKNKHHCVLGSIILLKQAEFKGVDRELLEELFIPAAFAISVHHEITWKKLSETHGLSELNFDKDPLSFLLLFCDAAQEFGRPQCDISRIPQLSDENNYILQEMSVTDSNCKIVIKSPFKATDSHFRDKQKELENVQAFIKPPSGIEFKITLLDKANTIHEYCMDGPN